MAEQRTGSGKDQPTRRASGSRGRRRNKDDSNGDEFQSSPEVRTALIEGNSFRAKAVQYAVIDGMAMFEGDIILGTVEEVEQLSEQLREELTGQVARGVLISGSQYRWPNCTVPYTIDPALPNQARVTDAIAHWQEKTNFTFVVRTTQADYVTFQPSTGCSAHVGKRGGQQFVNLASGCTKGNTIHEIGHAVGFWHEQSREDRDAHVTINWAKIQPGYEHNFNQHITDGDDIGAYDYGSIMHYPRNAFSIDGTDTITPLVASAVIGQRTALSAGDIATANSMCPPKLKKELVKDHIKEVVWDTKKELTKDIWADTRKELITDTRKELIKDKIKEVAFDPPWGKVAASDPIITGPGPVVQPVQPGVIGPGRLPFAVTTPHQAPAAEEPDQLEAAATDLDGRLQVLADQLAQVEAARAQLQAQYEETAALLNQAIDAHNKASG